MRSGSLKYESLVLEGKALRSRVSNGGVFEVNQNPVSSEQDYRREPQRDYDRKYMRHWFSSGGRHDERRSYCRDLTPQSNFISLF